MFTPQNNFIIVDDIQEHLDKLSKQFFENGIGCRTFIYDSFYDQPLKGVKVAFFDVIIHPSGGNSDPQIFNSLANGIKQYIHKDNGPFALIFWTSNISMIDEFKQFVQSRYTDIPKPFMVGCIDKDVFLNDTNQNLNDKLSEILNDKIIQLLFDFEIKLAEASAKTIQRIYNIVPQIDEWGRNDNFSSAFEIIFSKIAISTLGFQHAKDYPDKAITEALSQILLHQVLKSHTIDTWAPFLTSLQNAQKIKDIITPVGFRESELNSIFHIDTSILQKDTRGIVLNINKNKARIKKLFNKSYEEWIYSFIPFKTNFKAVDEVESVKTIERIILTSKLVAVEISSACDYSQNKSRLNKYIYGVIYDRIDDKLLDRNRAPECSLSLGLFFLDGKEFNICLNLNYIFSALPSNNILGKPLFLLKKEITDLIGNRYANHGSRIGITSF